MADDLPFRIMNGVFAAIATKQRAAPGDPYADQRALVNGLRALAAPPVPHDRQPSKPMTRAERSAMVTAMLERALAQKAQEAAGKTAAAERCATEYVDPLCATPTSATCEPIRRNK